MLSIHLVSACSNRIASQHQEANDASVVLRVGELTGSDEAEMVVEVPSHTAHEGRPVSNSRTTVLVIVAVSTGEHTEISRLGWSF